MAGLVVAGACALLAIVATAVIPLSGVGPYPPDAATQMQMAQEQGRVVYLIAGAVLGMAMVVVGILRWPNRPMPI